MTFYIMSWWLVTLEIIGFGFLCAAQQNWPAVIPRCFRSNTDFSNNCLLQAAHEAIPQMAKGIPEIGLAPLDPIRMVNLSIGSNQWPVRVTLKMNEVVIGGQSKLEIHSIRFDETKSSLLIEGIHRNLRMAGNYNIKGNIFIFPLNSQGYFTFDIRNTLAIHSVTLTNNTRDGFHGKIGYNSKDIQHITMNLRDPSLNTFANRALNRLVNDNWKVLFTALKPSMDGVIQETFTEAFSPLFSKFSVEQILPDEMANFVHRFYYDPIIHHVIIFKK